MRQNTEAENENDNSRERQRGSRRRSRGMAPWKVLLLVLLSVVLTGALTWFFAYRTVEEEYRYSRQPVVIEEGEAMKGLRENLAAGTSVTTSLRKAFRDYLILHDGSRYVFIPVNYDLKMHSLKTENLKQLTTGEWQYQENGKTISYKGIDVSSHQGEIAWQETAEDGVQFALLRAVYRGYESGKLVVDTCFNQNAAGAKEAGIACGAYLFSQAVTEAEIDEETELLIQTAEEAGITGPLIMDIELTEGGTGRADSLSMEERTALAKRFCENIEAAGYRPMLYYNFETALMLVDTEQLEVWDKWYASYTKEFYYPYYYTVWQYSSTGSVAGIEGDVDLDMSFEKFW